MSEANPEIAACGLFCGACRKYRKKRCPGCHANLRAEWCKVRSCCREHGWQSCAECTVAQLERCPEFNSVIGKLLGIVFRSDRHGCIRMIRRMGYDAFAQRMRASGCYNRPPKNETY